MLWGDSLTRHDCYARSGNGYLLFIGSCEVEKPGSLWLVTKFYSFEPKRDAKDVRALVEGLVDLNQPVIIDGMAKVWGTERREIELINRRLVLKMPREVLR